MKSIFVLIAFLITITLSGQYVESFDIPNKGVLSGPCGAVSSSCAVVDFTDVDWTVEGNFAGLDNNDSFSTTGGAIATGDIDEEVCVVTPIIYTSIATVTVQADLDWNGQDAGDYVNVDYNIDGVGWQQIPNQYGGGPGTVQYTSSGNTGSGLVSLSVSAGTSMQVRVCIDNNTSSEVVNVKSIMIPESGVSLPVVWGEVSVKSGVSSNALYWSTYSEINNDYFDIERSYDGRIFHSIGKVASSGLDQGQYEFEDHDIRYGEVYYRIKQIDYDGRADYSDIMQTRNVLEHNTLLVYPNPFGDEIIVETSRDSDKNTVKVEILDVFGKTVITSTIDRNESQSTFTTSDLPSGVYLLKVGNEVVQRITKR